MNIFVTGASGYIGGSLAVALQRQGHSIRGLTRSKGSAADLRLLGIDPVVGDLDDSQLLEAEARRSDAVINAANADHFASVKALATGLLGSNKKLIHTSGSSIIGDDARGNSLNLSIFSEDTPLVVDPRKQGRRDIDLFVMSLAKHGVRPSVVIPGLIYGYGHGIHKNSIQIPFLVKNAIANQTVQIVGQGVNTWSNIHIDDLVDLYSRVLESAPAGSFYFAENGEASFREIAEAISKRLKIDEIECLPAEIAADKWGVSLALFSLGSNSRVRALKARRELGWLPVRSSVQNWISNEMLN
jgi:nucleoside-diphosphate-sugar epimerase